MSTQDFKSGLADYYHQMQVSILTQFENVNRLVGSTRQYGEEGRYCEKLLANALRTQLPASAKVGTGFIVDLPSDTNRDKEQWISPQLDVIVYDPAICAPILQEGDLVVVSREPVHAAIEVKKTLNAYKLGPELSKLSKVAKNVKGRTNHPHAFCTCLVGFQWDVKQKSSGTVVGAMQRKLKTYAWDAAPEFIGCINGLAAVKDGFPFSMADSRTMTYSYWEEPKPGGTGKHVSLMLLLRVLYLALFASLSAAYPDVDRFPTPPRTGSFQFSNLQGARND